MKFGTSAPDDVDEVGGSGSFIRYFGKDGLYTLRFLEPWEQWTAYWEHYSARHKRSYPCTDDGECPGCALRDSQDDQDSNEGRRSKKLLVNAIRTDDERYAGYVDLWKIPGSLKEDLVLNNAKDKSLSKREYNIIRRDKNGRTAYSLDKEDPMPIDLSTYSDKLRDHQEALLEAWNDRWDEAKLAKKAEPKPVKEDDDPPPFDRKRTNLTVVPDEPEEDVRITVSAIRKMSVAQLTKLYAQGGFPVPDSDDQAVLAETLISNLS